MTRLLLLGLDKLPPKSGAILEVVLFSGEVPHAPGASFGTADRRARRIVAALLKQGVLTSESTRAQPRPAFPAMLTSCWMPGLFPEKVG